MKKYELVYQDLKAKIKSGKLINYLPPEGRLVEEYNVGRGTIRDAIKKLVTNGYCISQQGKRTKILPYFELPIEISGFKTFKETTTKSSWDTKICSATEIRITPKENEQTLFSLGSKAYYIERERIWNGEAVIFDRHYFLKSIVKELTDDIISTSIYEHLEHNLGIKPQLTRENWTCEFATPEVAKHLNISTSDLVVVNRKHVFLEDNTIFEYTESFHKPDFFHMKKINVRD